MDPLSPVISCLAAGAAPGQPLTWPEGQATESDVDEKTIIVYPFCEEGIHNQKVRLIFPRGPQPLRPVRASSGTPDAPPLTGAGAFQLSAYYDHDSENLFRRQFSGRAALRLHDARTGFAAVAIGDVGVMSLAYVRSTGHDVLVAEHRMLNLLVPVAGTLSSRNETMDYRHDAEPWVMFGRGSRTTTVRKRGAEDYEAFVLSVPPKLVGDGLLRIEERGGIFPADPSNPRHRQLAQLVLALATQLCVSEPAVERHVAAAWTTLLSEALGACLEANAHDDRQAPPPVEITGVASRHVRAAEAMIYDPTTEIPPPREIAQRIGISERTLQTAFRKVRGVTPHQVVATARLHRARRALLDPAGPCTVAEVCRMCGIDHHGRFSSHYRRAFGELPSATLNARPLPDR